MVGGKQTISAPDEWYFAFLDHFDDGARLNQNLYEYVNELYDRGLSPSEAAEKFHEVKLYTR